MTDEQQRVYVFEKVCRNRYKNSNASTKLGIQAVVEAVPVGLNFGTTNADAQADAWCSQNQKYESYSNVSINYENTVFLPSISAWSSCIASTNAGLQVRPEIAGDETSLTFQITNTTSDTDVVLQGVTVVDSSDTNSILCSVVTNQATEAANESTRKPLSPQQSVNVNCRRKLVRIMRDRQEIDIYPAGSVTLNTKLKNFQMSLLEKSAVRLTDLRADKLEQKLDALDKKVSLSEDCLRIQSTQICWGVVSIPANGNHILPFAWKFPKPFGDAPRVISSSDGNGGVGQTLGIYNFTSTKELYSGMITHHGDRPSPIQGTAVMTFMAIGKAPN